MPTLAGAGDAEGGDARVITLQQSAQCKCFTFYKSDAKLLTLSLGHFRLQRLLSNFLHTSGLAA